MEAALRALFGKGQQINFEAVKDKLLSDNHISIEKQVKIAEVDLGTYDKLLEHSGKEVANG